MLIWCLVAVAVIAAAAAAVLMIRSRALHARKRRVEAELAEARRQLGETQARLGHSEAELHRVLAHQDTAIREAERTAEENTKVVLKGAARLLQSLTAEATMILEGIQQKYGGHPVLADLLEVHHANAQMARKSQGIAVMCGAPLGRRTQPASVYDVVRSAQGQIRNYSRVTVMQHNGMALKASAVAPVALAVAELLDNAASFSQADAPIEVTFQQVQKNLCIIIDDAGVSMSDEERQKATALLSGDTPPQLSQLGTQPKFGFPVIGLIARHYGFKVDVTGVSRYGGVRAVVLLPEELWTMEEIAPPPTEEAPVRRIRRVEDHDDAAARTAHGLPKRGARQAPVESVQPAESGGPITPIRAPRRGLGGLQRGTLRGRDLAAPTPEGSEEA
ncbi:sensor histidine kinase [Streptomyces daghestanicus]|nr:sensor histidine kinase [Streptomyces daghestanicus]